MGLVDSLVEVVDILSPKNYSQVPNKRPYPLVKFPTFCQEIRLLSTPHLLAFCEFLNFENPLIQSKVMLILLKNNNFYLKNDKFTLIYNNHAQQYCHNIFCITGRSYFDRVQYAA